MISVWPFSYRKRFFIHTPKLSGIRSVEKQNKKLRKREKPLVTTTSNKYVALCNRKINNRGWSS
jgi:hypothetical protein